MTEGLNPDEEIKKLKSDLEAFSVSPTLRAAQPAGMGAYVGLGLPPRGRPRTASVEFVENGMLVRYPVVVKRTRKVGPRSPIFGASIQAMLEALMAVMDGAADADDDADDWKAEKRSNRLRKIFEKINAANAPKDVEIYYTEWRTVIAKPGSELEEALKKAKEAIDTIAAIEQEGKHIQPYPPPPDYASYEGGGVIACEPPEYELGA